MSIIFWLAAVAAVLLGIGVITARHPVHSAIALVGNLISLAVLFLLLQAEFLAIVEVLVYAGAVMVLFLFVITLLTSGKASIRETIRAQEGLQFQLPSSIGLGILFLALVAVAFLKRLPIGAAPANVPAGFGSIGQFGSVLFTQYLLPFEATAVLLLIAVIGVVVLGRQHGERTPKED